MAVSIDFDAPWDVQITQARAQNVKLSDIYYRLAAEKRAYAQTVSGLAQLDQVQRVADALAKAQAEGSTLADFKKWAKTQDWTLPKGRLETIYRNSVQTAYQAGHWRDFEENAVNRPYLMYDAINDSRVRPAHLAMDGIIKPVGDPFWLTHAAPNGHRCRCTLRSLSQREAMAKGGVTQNVPIEGKADEGWGHKPTEWDKTLKRIIEERQSACKANPANFGRKQRPVQANMDCTEWGTKKLIEIGKQQDPTKPMPAPKPISATKVVTNPLDYKVDQLFDLFMKEYGDSNESPQWMQDTGITVHPEPTLFHVQEGKKWKIGKNSRARYIRLLADTLRDPAMVREVEFNDTNAPKRLRVLGIYLINGDLVYTTLVYWFRDGVWDGKSAYDVRPDNWITYINEGLPIWVRP